MSILGSLAVIFSLLFLFMVQYSIRSHNEVQLKNSLNTHLEVNSNYFLEVINNARSNLDLISQNILIRQYFSSPEQDRYQLFHSEVVRLLERYLIHNPYYSEVAVILPNGYKEIYVTQTSDDFSFQDFDNGFNELIKRNQNPESELLFTATEVSNRVDLAIYRPINNLKQASIDGTQALAYLKISFNLEAIAKTLSSDQLVTSFHYGDNEIVSPESIILAGLDRPILSNDKYQFLQTEVLDSLIIQSTRNNNLYTDVSRKLFWQGLFLVITAISAVLIVSVITLSETILKPLKHFTDVIEESTIENYKKEKLSRFYDYEFIRLRISFNNLMERLQKSSKVLKQQALTDELTQLPNRAAFYQLMREHKKNCNNKRLSILFLDLDGFKQINDNHGHKTGDMLLVAVAKKLSKIVRHNSEGAQSNNDSRQDTVVRLGGDEFAIIMRNDSQAEIAANRIIKEMHQGFSVADKTLYTGVSIGIAVYPDHTDDTDLLIQYADIAMYDAKRNGKMRYSTFTPQMAKWEQRKLAIENAIRGGIEFNRFETHFQPKINCETGQIIGIEALARLKDENGKLISPADFIPIAQEYGVLEYITYIVTEHTCQLLQKIDNPVLGSSINISPAQLNDIRLIVDIRKILHRYNIDTQQIEFEVTEEELISNEFDVKNNLEFIRQFGFKTALDDFGAGYSSLGYLKNFHFDSLKLDQIFINTEDYASDASIAVIRSIKALAITLGMDIVAEGVETQSQVNLMQSLGIRNIQGYYYSRPLPMDDFLKLYMENRINIESYNSGIALSQ